MNGPMRDALYGDIDEPLIHALLDLLRGGPCEVEWLTARARARLRDATVDERAVISAVDRCTLLVGRPDGSVVRLLDLMEGQVLTHRVSQRTAGRADLWSDLALMPLLAWAEYQPLRLTQGGVATVAEFGHNALVGPSEWLPPSEPGQLLGLRLSGGRLTVEEVDLAEVSMDRDQVVRQVLTAHYRTHEWWADDDLAARPSALNGAIGHGLLQRPDLLAFPVSPLNELLYDALHEADRVHQFRDMQAWEAGDCVSFGISGMPESLYGELNRRAVTYGMSLDQFTILVLGHLAWRTPFAEDLGPWESWDSDPDPDPGDDADGPAGSVVRLADRLSGREGEQG